MSRLALAKDYCTNSSPPSLVLLETTYTSQLVAPHLWSTVASLISMCSSETVVLSYDSLDGDFSKFRRMSSIPTCEANVATVCTSGGLAKRGVPTDKGETGLPSSGLLL
ncbi:hypothetical protein L195_g026855 [Trifolium pratense]|uniref:Uncharacterized protein n=1 Tax=Trifolium pratense TaxID=57577 RepID=A0A2K3NKH7_TRIPR|nr:hypothetical protein L195_g026855 [Trifolium pratense]